jgi:hypothetical protein
VTQPNWSRDEIILGLSLYYQYGRHAPKEVLEEFSNFLRAYNPEAAAASYQFRSYASVHKRLGNFRHIEDIHAGLAQGRGLNEATGCNWRPGREVWREFLGKPHHLHECAEGIRVRMLDAMFKQRAAAVLLCAEPKELQS